MVVCNPLLQADCEGPYPHLLRRLLRHTDIGAPDLVGAVDGQAAQKVRIDLVLRMRFRGVRSLVDNRQPHQLHKAADSLTIDGMSLTTQVPCHLTGAVPRGFEMLLVDQTH